MRIAIFCHSLISDWNHGNAHFLRGITAELIARGHEVRVFEPRNAWSIENLLSEYGAEAIARFHRAFPQLSTTRYEPDAFDLETALDGVDLAIVHEWNDHALVRRIGELRAGSRFRLLFHDTHHRSVTDRSAMATYDLSNYDGVLAFGQAIRDVYLREGWAARAWIWHEAADTRVFRPVAAEREGDLVWIGNWGDEERSAELQEFLLEPVSELGLKARIHGVRYPDAARAALRQSGVECCGWLPNYEVPSVFARFRVTVHVPRRPYVRALPGIPTVRVFEALACGIPLVSAPWDDAERLFTPGEDFLVARDGREMRGHLRALLGDSDFSEELAAHGRSTVLERHTCAHRVDELMRIAEELGIGETCGNRATSLSSARA